MLERSEFALKILCGTMGLLLVYRLVLVIVHINPLYHLAIPALPTLSETVGTNSTIAAKISTAPEKAPTNVARVAMASGTNTAAARTNSSARTLQASQSGSNLVVGSKAPQGLSTNLPALGTNLLVQKPAGSLGTTNPISQPPGSSTPVADGKAGPKLRPGELGRRGQPPGIMGATGSPRPPLPADVQARIDRIVESEILAPVMRPLPMALLGIAGKDVFLRASNGQTGLVKEGDELGGVKLVRIGVNRVLVEEQGERKELTIFAGLGSESLLSTKKDSPK